MRRKMLLQSATLISLLFIVNSFLYGKSATIDYGDGGIYEGEVGYKELPEENRFNPVYWIRYKVFGVIEPYDKGKLTWTNSFAKGNSYEGDFIDGKIQRPDGGRVINSRNGMFGQYSICRVLKFPLTISSHSYSE